MLKTIVQWKIKTHSLDLVNPNDPVLKDIAKEFNIVFKMPVRVLRDKAMDRGGREGDNRDKTVNGQRMSGEREGVEVEEEGR